MKKVLGLGNALVDILTVLDSDKHLSSLQLPKGSMQLIDTDKMELINSHVSMLQKQMVTGGSAANTISGLSNLGIEAGYIGKIGEDEVGRFFENDMRKNGIKTRMLHSDSHSGCCLVLISPDSERTMCTHLGAASEMDVEDITSDLFKGFDIFHIEGYLVQNHNLIWKAADLAKKAGLQVSLDLASYNVVESNLDFLKKLMEQYIDIAFANEEEATAFTGKPADEAVKEIASICEIAVVKIGKKGSFVQTGDSVFQIDTPVVNVVDTTGAGDLYASGFLYGLANKYNLRKCGEIGSVVASNVVQTIGTKMTDFVWNKIKASIK